MKDKQELIAQFSKLLDKLLDNDDDLGGEVAIIDDEEGDELLILISNHKGANQAVIESMRSSLNQTGDEYIED